MKLRVAKKVLRPWRRRVWIRESTYRRAFRRHQLWIRSLLKWPKGTGWVAVRIEVAS